MKNWKKSAISLARSHSQFTRPIQRVWKGQARSNACVSLVWKQVQSSDPGVSNALSVSNYAGSLTDADLRSLRVTNDLLKLMFLFLWITLKVSRWKESTGSNVIMTQGDTEINPYGLWWLICYKYANDTLHLPCLGCPTLFWSQSRMQVDVTSILNRQVSGNEGRTASAPCSVNPPTMTDVIAVKHHVQRARNSGHERVSAVDARYSCHCLDCNRSPIASVTDA